MRGDQHAVLFEFVSGPNDGGRVTVVARSVAELTIQVAEVLERWRDYCPHVPPVGSAVEFDAWVDLEQAAVRKTEWTPDLYLRLVWRREGRALNGDLEQSLLAGDETGARALAAEKLKDGFSASELIVESLAPPLKRIGDGWARGDVSVAVEHRAKGIVEAILHDISVEAGHQTRGNAVVTTLTGNRHSLPALMATVALREDGWTVDHLGAELDVDDLRDFALSQPADLVVVPASTEESRERSLRAVESVDGHDLPVLVGGPGRTVLELQAMARGVEPR